MKAVLYDAGVGNLHSLAKALALAGATPQIERDPLRALDADLLVLPGVGAFGQAAAALAPAREPLRRALAAGLPCLGICLGMQLLFEESEEGEGAGLGIFPGRVTRLKASRVPHMGWSPVAPQPGALVALPPLPYFAHSFACRLTDPALAAGWTQHEGDRFVAAVRRGRTLGVQFHPEKSSRQGLAWLSQVLTGVLR